jgi:peptide/nickel transport system permease protein
MTKYIIRRLLQMFVTVVVASFVIYGAMQLVPGDPVLAMFFPIVPSPEVVQAVREQLGLNKPFVVRYFDYMVGVLVHGDLGQSYKQSRSVSSIIAENLPSTLELAGAGIIVALALGVPAGIMAALTSSKFFSITVMVLALVGVSTPSFWLGILLILVFSYGLGWFPTSGVGGISRLVLPGLTLGLYGAGYLARFTRSSVLEVKYVEYVTTARAKGLSEIKVSLRHILRNALIPVVTMAGLLAGYMLGGAVIVETVFGRLGIGHVLINAISNKDYPLVQGLLIFNVAVFCSVNLLVDLSYAYIDPRIRYE